MNSNLFLLLLNLGAICTLDVAKYQTASLDSRIWEHLLRSVSQAKVKSVDLLLLLLLTLLVIAVSVLLLLSL